MFGPKWHHLTQSKLDPLYFTDIYIYIYIYIYISIILYKLVSLVDFET